MSKHEVSEINWTGSENNFLDQPSVESFKNITMGRYGGSKSAGATKNEDGLLIWCDPNNDWEFVILLDAHSSSESAELIINTLTKEKENIFSILNRSIKHLFIDIESCILEFFKSENFVNACKKVSGETSCLICVRKSNFLWWFSVGDCMLFLFHADLLFWNQNMLNQRNFYEWIGKVNTFELEVPCYSSGRRELRTGFNNILMVTDGFLQNDQQVNTINNLFHGDDLSGNINSFVRGLHNDKTIDSTTLISWNVENIKSSSKPSDSQYG
ncbi:protein phosphatase 2C domain-containing protein [Paenibacillus psychroresistens]|uniref:Protein phosphatase 2C domain-containing protein n=2 Tax=Paenibacillus psychroresistens TaxID=1778678 RepID=A0A6B8RUX7_9BACL|nr:protein phosphatase 2C domain-containing protein [Paenibacillus psychroresistens]QGR00242.1 protein phosphatase 2C domain-containing protein [Paenibacillus psychroresistens]